MLLNRKVDTRSPSHPLRASTKVIPTVAYSFLIASDFFCIPWTSLPSSSTRYSAGLGLLLIWHTLVIHMEMKVRNTVNSTSEAEKWSHIWRHYLANMKQIIDGFQLVRYSSHYDWSVKFTGHGGLKFTPKLIVQFKVSSGIESSKSAKIFWLGTLSQSWSPSTFKCKTYSFHRHNPLVAIQPSRIINLPNTNFRG